MTSTILPISTSRFTHVQTVATWSSIEGIDSYSFSHSCFHKHIGCTCFFIVTDITEMKSHALASCGAWLSGGGGEMSRVSRRSGLQLTVLLVLLALLFFPAVCEHASWISTSPIKMRLRARLHKSWLFLKDLLWAAGSHPCLCFLLNFSLLTWLDSNLLLLLRLDRLILSLGLVAWPFTWQKQLRGEMVHLAHRSWGHMVHHD